MFGAAGVRQMSGTAGTDAGIVAGQMFGTADIRSVQYIEDRC